MNEVGDDVVPEDRHQGADVHTSPAPEPTSRKKGLRRRLVVICAAVMVAFVGVAILQAVTSTSTSSSKVLVEKTNQPAFEFTLHELTSPTLTLSLRDFRGKALVLNFWASWCVPCRTEMPLLEHAYSEVKGTVQFLGVDSNDDQRAGLAFYRRVHVSYPAVSDPSAVLAVRYGLIGFPTTVFISPTGKVLGRFIGQLSDRTLRAALKEAFGVSMSS